MPAEELFPAGHFDDMVAKLGLDRANNLAWIVLECNFFKLRYHLSFAKPAKIPTVFPRGAGREPAGDLVELFSVSKSLFSIWFASSSVLTRIWDARACTAIYRNEEVMG